MEKADIIALVFMLALALAFVWIGLLIWKKQRIDLIHEYHHTKVSKKDVPAYTKLMGIAMIVIGAGIGVGAAVTFLVSKSLGFPLVIAAIIAGAVLMSRAQKKFNGSWF